MKTFLWQFIWYPSFLKNCFHLSNVENLRERLMFPGDLLHLILADVWKQAGFLWDTVPSAGLMLFMRLIHELRTNSDQKAKVSRVPVLTSIWAEILYTAGSQRRDASWKEAGQLQGHCFRVHMSNPGEDPWDYPLATSSYYTAENWA